MSCCAKFAFRGTRSCFAACPQPANTSSRCWVECFYSTMLGPNASAGVSFLQ